MQSIQDLLAKELPKELRQQMKSAETDDKTAKSPARKGKGKESIKAGPSKTASKKAAQKAPAKKTAKKTTRKSGPSVSKEDQAFLEQPEIKAFMEKYRVDRTFILDQLPVFKQYLKEKKACANCHGLFICTRPIKGSVKTPRVDEDGSFNCSYEPCLFQIEEEKKLKARKNYLYSHLSLSDYGLNQKSLGDTQNDREYTLVAMEVLITSHQNNQGLLLYGNPGAGKSYLYKILANSLALQGKSVCFVFMPQLIRELRSEMEDKAVQKQILHNLISCDVLFLDDFGSELVSKWSRDDILLVILDARLNAHKLTYFSSNYAFAELARQYLLEGDKDAMARDRLLDRIRALAKPLQLKGTSRR